MRLLDLSFITLFSVIIVAASSCQSKKLISTAPTPALADADYLISGQFKILEVDNLGNIFLVTDNNEILKVDDGETLFRYSSKRLGNITRIDVTNPQKILVYYGDYYQIVFLDNTLSEIDRLDLDELGFWDVTSVALSRDNFIWIYDPVNVKLIKISQRGDVLLSTNELYNFGFNADYSPKILVHDTKVLLYDEQEIKVFDEYGAWMETIALENNGIQYVDMGILYRKDNKLMIHSTGVQFKETEQLILDVGAINEFSLSENQLHVIDTGGFRKVSLSK